MPSGPIVYQVMQTAGEGAPGPQGEFKTRVQAEKFIAEQADPSNYEIHEVRHWKPAPTKAAK